MNFGVHTGLKTQPEGWGCRTFPLSKEGLMAFGRGRPGGILTKIPFQGYDKLPPGSGVCAAGGRSPLQGPFL